MTPSLAQSLLCASIATWTHIYHSFSHIVINYIWVCSSHHTISPFKEGTCFQASGSVVSPFRVCFHHRQPPGRPTINDCSSWGFQVPASSARFRTTLMDKFCSRAPCRVQGDSVGLALQFSFSLCPVLLPGHSLHRCRSLSLFAFGESNLQQRLCLSICES